MTAVGAVDAYFCDAYADLLAATLIAKQRAPAIVLPERVVKIQVPLGFLLEPYDRQAWRWRMTARRAIERESVLSLDAVKKLLNGFLPGGHGFFRPVMANWMAHPSARRRQFGRSSAEYLALPPDQRRDAAKSAVPVMKSRYAAIFQRRNDCIHNCDRPKFVPQRMTRAGTVRNVIADLEFLVRRSDEHLETEFPQFLTGLGVSAAIRSTVGYP